MNPEQIRDKWLRLHRSYEKRAFKIFRDVLRESVNVPWSQMDLGNYKILIETNINDDKLNQAFYDVYLNIGSLYGKRIGQSINKEIREEKAFFYDDFVTKFQTFLVNWLQINGGSKIVSVRQNLIEYLIAEVQRGISQELTIREIAKAMQELVNSRKFYRWQALRIARTETTAAANLGATRAGSDSGLILEKVWISSHDSRTRRRPDDKFDHYVMHKVKVDENDHFNVQGDLMLYPGDPKGQPANQINCRCTVAMIGKRDSNGRLLFR